MADDTTTINAKERIELKAILVEMTKLMVENDSNRQSIKDFATAGEEKFGIKKKQINKLAKTMYKHNYADLQAENEHFEYLYEAVIEGKNG